MKNFISPRPEAGKARLIRLGRKKITILILVIAVIAVVLVYAKKANDEPVVENGNGQIDTSDWLTYRNEEYGFEIKYPEEWSNITEKINGGPEYSTEPVTYINPKYLALNFSNFLLPKHSIVIINKDSYEDYARNNFLLDHNKRYQELRNIYNSKSIDHFNLTEFNPGSASYSLFGEEPDISKYIESNNGKYKGIAYYSISAPHDVMAVSHIYSVVLSNKKGNIIDMRFVFNNKFFKDLNDKRSKELEDNYIKNNKVVDLDGNQTIIKKWDEEYKKRFNELSVDNNEFKTIMNNIELIVKNLQ